MIERHVHRHSLGTRDRFTRHCFLRWNHRSTPILRHAKKTWRALFADEGSKQINSPRWVWVRIE